MMVSRISIALFAIASGATLSVRARAAAPNLSAHAEPQREFTLSIRGGALTAPASSYRADAEAFGFTGLGSSGGLTVQAGYEIRDRLVLGVTYSHFAVESTRRLSTLRLDTSVLLGGATYTVARADWGNHLHWRLLVDASAAAGLYFLDEKFDDRTRSVQGLGARAGFDVAMFYRSVGFAVGFAYHASQATLNDLIGGKMEVGGIEVTAGLSLRI